MSTRIKIVMILMLIKLNNKILYIIAVATLPSITNLTVLRLRLHRAL